MNVLKIENDYLKLKIFVFSIKTFVCMRERKREKKTFNTFLLTTGI